MLELNHAGQHDSHFCLWDDNQAISKREADKILAEKTGGREVLALEDLIFGGDSDPED